MGSLPYQQFHDAIVRRPWRGMYMPHPTWMGRAEWFRRWKYCYPEAVRAEDQELLLRALPSSRYHCLSEILVAYRQGSFNYRKTLLARRSLLAAQLRIFGRRGSYADLIKSLAATAVKVATDTMAAIPGCDRVFFYRMSYPTEQEAKKQLKDLLCRLYGNVE
jgi:hypothetical protein